MTNDKIPAAEYLRMSTDHQQYSLHNQSTAIAQYAEQHGFEIVKTYSDAAKSGLRLKNRAGLKQLLKDVVNGDFQFRAILVYDVSRWGRFQDTDEAAHYEYLCKSAGAPIHYCAEIFGSGNTPFDLMMKSLKRTMAGEYSRDLSERVRRGLFNLASRGYCSGGSPSYGFRRQLVDRTGTPKQLLGKGERKSISTDRVILVPGCREEIAVVRRIFRLFVSKQQSISRITEILNRDRIPFLEGRRWAEAHVSRVLRNPRYCGTQVWGRTTARLFAPVKRVDPQQWATCHGAFAAIIKEELFYCAQDRIANFACNLSDEQLIEKLRSVLKANGNLSAKIIEASPLCPTARTYYQHFGGLAHVYAKVGINRPELLAALATRRKLNAIRKELIASFLKRFPNDLKEVHPTGSRSSLMHCDSGMLIGAKLASCRWNQQKGRYWLLECKNARPDSRARITVLALLDEKDAVEKLRIVPGMGFSGRSVRIYDGSEFFERGLALEHISDFLKVLELLLKSTPTLDV